MRQCPVLVYHWFRTPGSAPLRSPHQLEITPRMFERQMRMLKHLGYKTVPLKGVIHAETGYHLPTKPVVITFDDGTLDFWEFAKPILFKYGFTATLFIVTGYVGKESGWDQHLGISPRPLMSWEQIVSLHEAGFGIGSHTHTHRPFTTISEGDVRVELTKSRKVLADKIGTAPEFVAYPRGFYHARHKQMVQETGYQGACAVVLGVRDLLHSDRFELKRIMIKGKTSITQFRARLLLSGVIPFSQL